MTLTTRPHTAADTPPIPAVVAASPRSWPRGRRHLRYGGDYNPEQWPRETWREDVALMRDAGVDLVSVGIFAWALVEPEPGRFDFGWLDEVMDLLAAAGVDVDLGTPTAAPPAWFWRDHPSARPVTREGVTLGFGSRGMASPSSPDYRRAATAVTAALAERYAGHPALVMWHVHNEYGAPVSESYDGHSVVAFRRWLANRHGSLAALNDAWGTTFWGQRYGAWDEIDAPRKAASISNPAQRLDFARFSSDALLACFVAERDTIRAHTPDLPVTTNFMATSCPSVDYWAWAREVDIVSNDHYLTAERPDSHVMLSMDADLTRSLAGGAPWMLMEHSTSAVNWQPRNLAKRPGELARNSLAHVARGADAVMFFQFRASRFGAEKFHSAMLPHAGTGTRVWREVGELGAVMDRLPSIDGTRVQARVALVWDWPSFWAHDLDWRPSVDARHRERVEAFYAAFWRRNVTVDFVSPSAPLDGYDLVVVPSLYLVSVAAGENLSAYVHTGGHLLVSYFSGMVDEHDAVHPGGFPGPLRVPLGLVVDEVLPFAAGETAPLEGGGTGAVWADDIRSTTASTVLRFAGGRATGQPAVTRNRHGSGTAWYVATTLDDATLDGLLDEVLAAAGVAAGPVDGELEVVERVSPDSIVRFHLNHGTRERSVAADGWEVVEQRPVDSDLVVPAGAVRIVHTPRVALSSADGPLGLAEVRSEARE